MKHDSVRGTALAFGAYSLWGILPLYWKTLQTLDPSLVLAHRIIWALASVFLVIMASKGFKEIRELFSSPRRLLIQTLGALLIAGNWWLYIWSVGSGHVIEGAMGYYINPLISVVLGILFLKEKLTPLQILAFGLAAAGVLYMTLSLGRPPWVALGLALSFGLYGLIKKKSQLSSFGSLQIETLLSLPLATLLFFQAGAQSPQSLELSFTSPELLGLLILSGPLTIIPLWLFGSAAKLIPLSRIGFIQYLSPTLNLILGILVFHENFSTSQAWAFLGIWSGIAVYTFDSIRSRKRPPLRL